MASAALLIGSLVFTGASTIIGNISASKQAQAQIDELERQKKRERLIAQEKKSDIAREEDREIGAMLAAQADTGATIGSLARFGGEIAGIAGLDIARIESNVQERNAARRAKQLSIAATTKSQILGNTLSFFGKALGAGSSFLKKAPKVEANKFKPTAQSGGE